MIRPSTLRALTLSAGCLGSSHALATSYVPMTLTELAQQADAIFVGTLDDQVSGIVPRKGVVSHHQFTGVHWLKGGAGGADFVLQSMVARSATSWSIRRAVRPSNLAGTI